MIGTAWNDTGNDSTKGHENGFTSANVRNKVDGHEFTTGNNEFAAGNGEFIAGGYEFAPGDAVGASSNHIPGFDAGAVGAGGDNACNNCGQDGYPNSVPQALHKRN